MLLNSVWQNMYGVSTVLQNLKVQYNISLKHILNIPWHYEKDLTRKAFFFFTREFIKIKLVIYVFLPCNIRDKSGSTLPNCLNFKEILV